MQIEDRSLALRMRTFSLEERQKTMAAAAEAMTNYYQTDPEVLEWLNFAEEDFDEDILAVYV